MSLRVTISNAEGDSLVLHLSGNLTLSPETDALESFLPDVVDRGFKKVVLDLGGVAEVEPDAIALLVRCFNKTSAAGGQLRFVKPSEEMLQLVQAAKLDTLFPFDPTVAAALNHLKGGAGTGE